MKKVSIDDFEKICKINSPKNLKEIEFDINDEKSIKVIVKRVLSLKGRISFVSEVVDSCFDDNGEFLFAVKNIAFEIAILKYFTNLTLPKNPEKIYNLIIHSNVLEKIETAIDSDEYCKLWKEIEEAIDYKKENAIAKQKANLVKITTSMNAITEQYYKMFEEVDVSDFITKLNSVNEQISKLSSKPPQYNIACT